MNKINLTLSVLLLTLSLTFGCSDLLNAPKPSNELDYDSVLNDAGTVNSVRIKMYDYLHTWNFTGLYLGGPDIMADGFIENERQTRATELFHGYDRAGMAGGFQYSSGVTTYAQVYNIANAANTILTSIPEGVVSDIELDRFKGEAYFFRAFGYFFLTNIIGYIPGAIPTVGQGRDFDLGIILQTEPIMDLATATAEEPRNTIIETYDFIIDDLKKAIDLLSVNPDAQSASVNYIKAEAAEALLARVYLYYKDYPNAHKYASDALAHTTARIATPSEVSTMFDETKGVNPEALFILDVNPDNSETRASDSISGFTSTFWNTWLPSPEILALYESNDVRRTAWYGPCYSDSQGACESVIYGVNEEIKKWDGEKGRNTDDIPYFRVSELLLIQTEARLHDSSLGDPLTPINELRINRGLNTLTNVDIEEVLDERQRELVGEGHRWFDLKRLGRDIKKTAKLPDIPFTDYRLLDDIPERELLINKKLVQNPGYNK